MGFFSNIFGEYACPEFDDLLLNHREALENWLQGGYRPRSVMPKSVRLQFAEYDKKWKFIHEKTGHSFNLEMMDYSQKRFCISHKEEILRLYSIFSIWKDNENTIYYVSTYYPYGINAVAIKYLGVCIANFYRPNLIELPKRHMDEIDFFMYSFVNGFKNHPTLISSIDELTSIQVSELLKRTEEIKIAHKKYMDVAQKEQMTALGRDKYTKKIRDNNESRHATVGQKSNQVEKSNYNNLVKKIEYEYGAQLNEVLSKRDYSLPYLAIGLDNPTAFGNNAVIKFCKSTKDKDVEWRFSIHYIPYFIKVNGLSNNEVRQEVIKIMARHFKIK